MQSYSDQRRARRSSLASSGTATVNDKSIPFHARDISLGGCCLEMGEGRPLQIGMSIQVHLPIMGITSKAVVRWLSSVNGILIAGFEFHDLIFSVEKAA
jgi:hypothetical protein